LSLSDVKITELLFCFSFENACFWYYIYMNKKKKMKNIFAFTITGVILFTIILVIIIKSKKTEIVDILPIQNSERFCYVLESKTDPASGFDFAFVDLEISGSSAKAVMKLALPNTPIIVGTLNGNYDSAFQRINGTYTGTIQGTPFSESRIAQITADGFVFAQSITEIEELVMQQDTSYVIPSASCERFDQLKKVYISE
jgi:hypothetical protein